MRPKSQRWWLTEDWVELDIDADAGVLYGMVCDLPRIGEWSPECRRCTWLDGATAPTPGSRFKGHNRRAVSYTHLTLPTNREV